MYFSDEIALRSPINKYDETYTLGKMSCCPEEDSITDPRNTREQNELNSIVRLVQGSHKNLAIQLRGETPFIEGQNFDSTRPLLYINEDSSHVFVYKYCPNVTQGSEFRKWSLVNIWSKQKSKFILPVNKIFGTCPHTLFNQTLIFGSFIYIG